MDKSESVVPMLKKLADGHSTRRFAFRQVGFREGLLWEALTAIHQGRLENFVFLPRKATRFPAFDNI